MNPANIGTFIHHGLERLLSGEFDLEGDISAHIDTISDDYKNSVLKDCTGQLKTLGQIIFKGKGCAQRRGKQRCKGNTRLGLQAL